jgi:hypothetical protein
LRFFLVARGGILFTECVRLVFFLVATIILAYKTSAFSILGPFEESQTPALGYNALGTEVGAPKNLGEEYRWNVPVITYGFDASFLDYFGKTGATAIDQAFAILNSISPATQIDGSNINLDTRRYNYRAQEDNVMDLKSIALGLLLEQLGLASPENNVWCLRDREVSSVPNSITNYYVVNRNFDPTTFLPSAYVNEARYTYQIFEFNEPGFADAVELSVNPENRGYSSVAGRIPGPLKEGLSPGMFVFYISRDDAGGLKYLLTTNNVNLELLPDGVTAGDGSSNFVNMALRPGVEKLTFEKITEAWYGNTNWSKTLVFTDSYILDGMLHRQELQRTIKRPDIVFSASDLGSFFNGVTPVLYKRSVPQWTSALGQGQLKGPGTLQGPVTITFAKLGAGFFNNYPGNMTERDAASYGAKSMRWGWVTGSVGPIISFPVGINDGFPSMLLSTQTSDGTAELSWTVAGYPVQYMIESTTDLKSWTEFRQITATNGNSLTISKEAHEPFRFFRVRSKASL